MTKRMRLEVSVSCGFTIWYWLMGSQRTVNIPISSRKRGRGRFMGLVWEMLTSERNGDRGCVKDRTWSIVVRLQDIGLLLYKIFSGPSNGVKYAHVGQHPIFLRQDRLIGKRQVLDVESGPVSSKIWGIFLVRFFIRCGV